MSEPTPQSNPIDGTSGAGNRPLLVYVQRIIAVYRAKFLAELQARLPVDVVAIASDRLVDEASRKVLVDGGVELDLLAGEKVVNDNTHRLSTPLFQVVYQPGLFKAAFKRQARYVMVEGFGFWTWPAVALKLFRGAKVIISWERTPFTERNVGLVKGMYYRLMAKAGDAFIANGNETRKALAALGVPGDRVFSPNFTAFIEPTTFPAEREKSDTLRVVYAGRLVREKGMSEMIAAWDELRASGVNATLELFGDGPLRSLVEEAASRNPLIRYGGKLPQEELQKVLQTRDVFLLPTYQDNWSLALLEAANCGMALITTPFNGSTSELLGTNSPQVVTLDGGEIAAAVRRLAENPAEVARLQADAFARSRPLQLTNAVQAVRDAIDYVEGRRSR